jgi:hypothetical protein
MSVANAGEAGKQNMQRPLPNAPFPAKPGTPAESKPAARAGVRGAALLPP